MTEDKRGRDLGLGWGVTENSETEAMNVRDARDESADPVRYNTMIDDDAINVELREAEDRTVEPTSESG